MTWVALEHELVCDTEGCCGEEICGSCTCCDRGHCSYELIVEGPVAVTFTPPPAQ